MDSKAARKMERAEKRKMEKVEIQYYRDQLDRLAKDDKREQLAFPPTLTKGQRKKLHVHAHGMGLKSKSSGSGRAADVVFNIAFSMNQHYHLTTKPETLSKP